MSEVRKMNVIEEIAAERSRQIEVEGFTPQRDDSYRKRELALAALGYVQVGTMQTEDTAKFKNNPPLHWPWPPAWWKPTTPRRDLIKAAALIVAEIERMDRRP